MQIQASTFNCLPRKKKASTTGETACRNNNRQGTVRVREIQVSDVQTFSWPLHNPVGILGWSFC